MNLKINIKYKKKIVIDIDNNNRRIDNYIFSNFNNLSKSLIYKYIRKGIIKLNTLKVKPNHKIKFNDIIYLPLNIYKKEELNLKKNNKNIISNNILYEDKYLIIINKPSGILVHGGNKSCTNIISNIKLIKSNEKKLNLVHRLDKETSGILLISKNLYILKCLHNQFKNNLICRNYIALVNGKWNEKNKIINIPLSKILNYNKKYISKIDENGKNCCSIFEVQKKFSKFTLMKIKLITGRYHQIRIHAKHCGNPIVYDKIYGDTKFNLEVKKFGLNRLFLHANYVEFIHPIFNKKICINSTLDKNLSNFIKKLNCLS